MKGSAAWAVVLLAVLAGCGDDQSAEQIESLERRVTALEAANASQARELKTAVGRLETDLEELDARTAANDRALETGVTMAHHTFFCEPFDAPGCHIPLSIPGALFRTTDEPGRIFATPFP